MRLTFTFLIPIMVGTLVWADSPPLPAGLSRCGSGVVISIQSGDSLTLKTGEKIRLAAIKAPHIMEDPRQNWPYAKASKKALENFTLDQQVTLYCKGKKRDRFDQLVGYLSTPENGWINHQMVEGGWAFVYPWQHQNAGLFELYQAEDQAVQSKSGIWKDSHYQVFNAANPKAIPIDKFITLTGIVKEIGRARGLVYLNFGSDYRTDFTIRITRDAIEKLEKEKNISYNDLKGKKIWIRGWTIQNGGPMIDLRHSPRLRLIP